MIPMNDVFLIVHGQAQVMASCMYSNQKGTSSVNEMNGSEAKWLVCCLGVYAMSAVSVYLNGFG